ncbi:hypothetical protein [Streptomyces hirsutus]|uniref:hypothetical protein n=1 Tax=Streptomyces hirsutus TaxID=35620 RepID=UPI00099E8419|nr:hypothetical protein [Streptomyces hirsutus]
MVFMEQGGSTMGEEPAGAELLLTFFLVAAIPTVVGGAVILSLVGLTSAAGSSSCSAVSP